MNISGPYGQIPVMCAGPGLFPVEPRTSGDLSGEDGVSVGSLQGPGSSHPSSSPL